MIPACEILLWPWKRTLSTCQSTCVCLSSGLWGISRTPNLKSQPASRTFVNSAVFCMWPWPSLPLSEWNLNTTMWRVRLQHKHSDHKKYSCTNLVVLGIKSRALHVRANCSTTELHHRPFKDVLKMRPGQTTLRHWTVGIMDKPWSKAWKRLTSVSRAPFPCFFFCFSISPISYSCCGMGWEKGAREWLSG